MVGDITPKSAQSLGTDFLVHFGWPFLIESRREKSMLFLNIHRIIHTLISCQKEDASWWKWTMNSSKYYNFTTAWRIHKYQRWGASLTSELSGDAVFGKIWLITANRFPIFCHKCKPEYAPWHPKQVPSARSVITVCVQWGKQTRLANRDDFWNDIAMNISLYLWKYTIFFNSVWEHRTKDIR